MVGRLHKIVPAKFSETGKKRPASFQIQNSEIWYKVWEENLGTRQVGDLIDFEIKEDPPWTNPNTGKITIQRMATISDEVPSADANADMPPKPTETYQEPKCTGYDTQNNNKTTAEVVSAMIAKSESFADMETVRKWQKGISDQFVDNTIAMRKKLNEPTFDEKYEAENNGVDIFADEGGPF